MAKRTVVSEELTDDLDGSRADGTVRFGFDGTDYEIELSKANRRAFEKAMAVYVGHARKVRGTTRRSSASRPASRDLSGVRAWAAENGYEVAPRGRVPAPIMKAYEDAH